MSSGNELVGRDAEFARIRDFTRRALEGPRGLLFTGEAGIGKTALWASALDVLGTSARVLQCRGVEAEATLSFAGLGDLLVDVLPAIADGLPAPRRRAL